MKAFVALFALLVALTDAPILAKAANLSDQVHEMLLVVFQSIGTDENGTVRAQDADAMIRATYNAMDANGDGRVTPDEFKAFSMGFEYLAQVRAKLVPFNAAKVAVFRRWDVNKAGFLTYQEYRAGMLGDLTRSAGRNDTTDLKLSVEELQRADFVRELTEALR